LSGLAAFSAWLFLRGTNRSDNATLTLRTKDISWQAARLGSGA